MTRSPNLQRPKALSASVSMPELRTPQKSPAGSAGGSRHGSPMSTSATKFLGRRCAITETPRLENGARRPHQRFTGEELTCFRRLPSPSALCDWKAEIYWRSMGELRRVGENSPTPSSPQPRVVRGNDFFLSGLMGSKTLPEVHQIFTGSSTEPAPEKVPPLPMEADTASVLEQIYPRSLSAGQLLCDDDEDRFVKNSRFRRTRLGSTMQPGAARDATLSLAAASIAGGGGAAPSSALPLPLQVPRRASSKLLVFRQRMLEKFPTVAKAFETFLGDYGQKELSRKEFGRFLTRHFGDMSKEDHERIFDLLDSGSGFITMNAFHTALEAASLVRGMEDLRRKLIALGWGSMRQALRHMAGDRQGSRRLTLQAFGEALSRVGISYEDEHRCLFAAICDPLPGGADTVSLNELASALSAVSPPLVLEDIRHKLLGRYPSTLKAFEDMERESHGGVPFQTFKRVAMHHWDLSRQEAEKAFSLMDTNRRHWIGRVEFESALRLSETGLHLEELRWKVRQRFRSICDSLQQKVEEEGQLQKELTSSRGNQAKRRLTTEVVLDALGSPEEALEAFTRLGEEEALQLKRTPEEWRSTLGEVQLSEPDTRLLLDMVDNNQDGHLTAREFVRGIHLFAPSCVLEDLRCKILRRHATLADAFAGLPRERREAAYDSDGLTALLQELDLASGVHVRSIADLVEPHTEGLTISELLAALRCSSPGAQVRLPTAQRDARARQQVKWSLAPFHRSATELRARVRLRPPTRGDEVEDVAWRIAAEEANRGNGNHRLSNAKGFSRSMVSVPSAAAAAAAAAAPRQRLTSPSQSQSPTVKTSYSKVSQLVRSAERQDGGAMLERLRGYYSSAGSAMASDGQLLAERHSRLKHFRSSSGHYAVLSKTVA